MSKSNPLSSSTVPPAVVIKKEPVVSDKCLFVALIIATLVVGLIGSLGMANAIKMSSDCSFSLMISGFGVAAFALGYFFMHDFTKNQNANSSSQASNQTSIPNNQNYCFFLYSPKDEKSLIPTDRKPTNGAFIILDLHYRNVHFGQMRYFLYDVHLEKTTLNTLTEDFTNLLKHDAKTANEPSKVTVVFRADKDVTSDILNGNTLQECGIRAGSILYADVTYSNK